MSFQKQKMNLSYKWVSKIHLWKGYESDFPNYVNLNRVNFKFWTINFTGPSYEGLLKCCWFMHAMTHQHPVMVYRGLPWCHSLGLCFSEHFFRTMTRKYFSPEYSGWYLWSSWIAYTNKRTNCLCKSDTSGAVLSVNRDALVFLLSLLCCNTQQPCCWNLPKNIFSELTVPSLPFQAVFCWTRAPLGGCCLDYWSVLASGTFRGAV